MNVEIMLKRLRLEVDRTVRTRAFFARAIRDELPDEAYGELVAQLGYMASALGGIGERFSALAETDLEQLETDRGEELQRSQPCIAVKLFRSTRSQYEGYLSADAALEAGVLVLGTSWTRDAEASIGRHTRRARAFLSELGSAGASSVSRIRERLDSGETDPQVVYSFAELTRGALLGIANDLDSRWPASLVVSPVLKG